MLWVKSVRTEEQTSWLNSEVSEVCASFGSPFVLVPQSVSGLSMCRDLQVSDKTDLSDAKKKKGPMQLGDLGTPNKHVRLSQRA